MTATDYEEDYPEIVALKVAVGKLLTGSARAPLPPVVYHYTSLDTAIKILNGFEMWCANVAFANDPSEGVHGQQVIADVLAKDRHFKLSGAQKLIADEIDGYAVSFSAEPDQLTQWRSYCSNGRGVAIGIDTAVLSERKTVAFSHVEYDSARQEWLVQELLALFRAPIISATFQPTRLHRLVATLTLSLVIVRAMLKNHAYHSEREYRLLDALPKDPANHTTLIEFFPRGTLSVPFFRVDLRASNAPGAMQPVREVWIGPCLDFPSSSAAIQGTCAHMIEAFPIIASKVPMRC
jgi:hypothetical protein